MINKKIEELKKGCKIYVNTWNNERLYCGLVSKQDNKKHFCPICQAKLSAYEDAQKIFSEKVKELKDDVDNKLVNIIKEIYDSQNGIIKFGGKDSLLTLKAKKEVLEELRQLIQKHFGSLADDNSSQEVLNTSKRGMSERKDNLYAPPTETTELNSRVGLTKIENMIGEIMMDLALSKINEEVERE